MVESLLLKFQEILVMNGRMTIATEVAFIKELQCGPNSARKANAETRHLTVLV
jgi:hypothetical protein